MRVTISKIIDNKTIKAVSKVSKKHDRYGKFISIYKNFLVHSIGFDVKIGQEVIIESSRPYSKNKKWVLKNIISGA
jgi:small subunit ribosomal protein S17